MKQKRRRKRKNINNYLNTSNLNILKYSGKMSFRLQEDIITAGWTTKNLSVPWIDRKIKIKWGKYQSFHLSF